MPRSDPSQKHQALAVRVATQLNPEDRPVLKAYAEDLLAIRESDSSVARKAMDALDRTVNRELMRVFTTTAAKSLVKVAWQDRTWAARLGLSAAAVAAATTAGQGAGIAAFGSAIGVPLWVVLGAGGAFAGVLVDELTQAGDRPAVRAADEELEPDYYLLESTDPEHIVHELDDDLSGRKALESFDRELGLDPASAPLRDQEEADGPELDLGAVWNRLLLRLRQH
jgi:hypothetical protein